MSAVQYLQTDVFEAVDHSDAENMHEVLCVYIYFSCFGALTGISLTDLLSYIYVSEKSVLGNDSIYSL